MLVTFPFLLVLLDYWPLRRIKNISGLSRMLLEKLPFLGLSAVSSIVTFVIQRNAGAVASLQNVSVLARISNVALSYFLYLGKLFWPVNLMIPYVPERERNPVVLYVAVAVLVIVTAFVLIRNSRQRYLIVGWLWYLGTLIPVIGVVQVGIQSMADRYTYMPSIGIFIILTWRVADIFDRLRVQLMPKVCVSCAVLMVSSALTTHQLAFWKNSETLFLHSASVDPTNLPVASLLAWTYATDPNPIIRDGQKAVSLAEFCVQQSERREPWYLDVLAAAYAECGQFSLAVTTAHEALLLVGTNSQTEFATDVRNRIEIYTTGRAIHRR